MAFRNELTLDTFISEFALTDTELTLDTFIAEPTEPAKPAKPAKPVINTEPNGNAIYKYVSQNYADDVQDWLHLDRNTLRDMCTHHGISTYRWEDGIKVSLTKLEMVYELVAHENDVREYAVLLHPVEQPSELNEHVPAPNTLKHSIEPGRDMARMTYRELQQACAKVNLKANGSREALLERLEAHVMGTATPDMYKKAKAKKGTKKGKVEVKNPSAVAQEKRDTASTLTYRQAQRLVKYGSENVVGFEKAHKNAGWDNVKANLELLLNCDHFKKLQTNTDVVNEISSLMDTPLWFGMAKATVAQA